MVVYENNLIWIFIYLNKTLEMNEKSQKNQGGILIEELITQLIIALDTKLDIKVMLRHGTRTLWSDMKGI